MHSFSVCGAVWQAGSLAGSLYSSIVNWSVYRLPQWLANWRPDRIFPNKVLLFFFLSPLFFCFVFCCCCCCCFPSFGKGRISFLLCVPSSTKRKEAYHLLLGWTIQPCRHDSPFKLIVNSCLEDTVHRATVAYCTHFYFFLFFLKLYGTDNDTPWIGYNEN